MTEDDWNFPEGRFLAYVLAALEDGGEPLFIVFNARRGRNRVHPAGMAERRALDLLCSTPPATPYWRSGPSRRPAPSSPAPAISVLAFAGKP